MSALRRLAVVLGDQLDLDSPLLRDFDPACDAVWMAEVADESLRVPSHKARTALFLSAMRHFAGELRARGITVHYRRLEDPANRGSLAAELSAAVDQLGPREIRIVETGDWHLEQSLLAACGGKVAILEDPHFLSSRREFAAYAQTRKQLRLEFFYRDMRRKHRILMDGATPAGGAWNFDAANRESFGKRGPGSLPAPLRFAPDAITQEVLALVARRFPSNPGSLAHFDWPVTRSEALAALDDFIAHRLPCFGRFEDAMWTGEPWLYHSRLSSSLNLKLLGPREVIAAAERAYSDGAAPLAAVEGFIRQILGWREYVRGIYWTFMPGYAEGNALDAHAALPDFYWTGETDMNCMRQSIRQTLDYGYAHHIQRLMVTGLYALLAGVEPKQIHHWYLGVYVDAVEWVELPNTLGMSQFADGGIMSSKPYAATGRYIDRMSNYCSGCRYDPAASTGERACPFTALYWDFLERNESKLRKVPRMELQLRNLERRRGKEA